MIRKLLTKEDFSTIACKPVDTTFENGLLHSCHKPPSGLLRDLFETAKFNEACISVLTADQIGYLGFAMVLKMRNGFGILLNPVIKHRGGKGSGYYKTITVSFCDHLGFDRTVKFRGIESRRVQEGLHRMGIW